MSKRMFDDRMDEISEYAYEEWLDLDTDDKMEFCRTALANLSSYDPYFDMELELEDLIAGITDDLKTGEAENVGEAVDLIKDDYESEDFDDEDED